MIKPTTDFKSDLVNSGLDATEVDYNQRGYHLEVVLNLEQVRNFAAIMYEHDFYLVFLTALHVQPEEQADTANSGLVVIYQFARFDRLCRGKGQIVLPADKTVPSICDIYQGANWHERETRDMYGVIFSGHPNLTPLLLVDADRDYHPLLKEGKQLQLLEAVSWPVATAESDEIEPAT